MTAVPRCLLPADDRRDNPDRLRLARPRPVTRVRAGTGATPSPMPLRPCPARPDPAPPPRGAVDAAAPMDAKSAPTGAWKTAKNAVSHSAHNPSSFFVAIGKSTGPIAPTGAEHSWRPAPGDTNPCTTRHEGRFHAITPATGGEPNRENRDL